MSVKKMQDFKHAIKLIFFLSKRTLEIFLVEVCSYKITCATAIYSGSNFRADYDTCRAACLTSSICALVLLASGCDRRQTNLNERIT